MLALIYFIGLSTVRASWSSHFYSVCFFYLLGVNGAFLTGIYLFICIFWNVLSPLSVCFCTRSIKSVVTSGSANLVSQIDGSLLLLHWISNELYSVTGHWTCADIALKLEKKWLCYRTLSKYAWLLFVSTAFLIKALHALLSFGLLMTYFTRRSTCRPDRFIYNQLMSQSLDDLPLLGIGILLCTCAYSAPGAWIGRGQWLYFIGFSTS